MAAQVEVGAVISGLEIEYERSRKFLADLCRSLNRVGPRPSSLSPDRAARNGRQTEAKDAEHVAWSQDGAATVSSGPATSFSPSRGRDVALPAKHVQQGPNRTGAQLSPRGSLSVPHPHAACHSAGSGQPLEYKPSVVRFEAPEARKSNPGLASRVSRKLLNMFHASQSSEHLQEAGAASDASAHACVTAGASDASLHRRSSPAKMTSAALVPPALAQFVPTVPHTPPAGHHRRSSVELAPSPSALHMRKSIDSVLQGSPSAASVHGHPPVGFDQHKGTQHRIRRTSMDMPSPRGCASSAAAMSHPRPGCVGQSGARRASIASYSLPPVAPQQLTPSPPQPSPPQQYPSPSRHASAPQHFLSMSPQHPAPHPHLAASHHTPASQQHLSPPQQHSPPLLALPLHIQPQSRLQASPSMLRRQQQQQHEREAREQPPQCHAQGQGQLAEASVVAPAPLTPVAANPCVSPWADAGSAARALHASLDFGSQAPLQSVASYADASPVGSAERLPRLPQGSSASLLLSTGGGGGGGGGDGGVGYCRTGSSRRRRSSNSSGEGLSVSFTSNPAPPPPPEAALHAADTQHPRTTRFSSRTALLGQSTQPTSRSATHDGSAPSLASRDASRRARHSGTGEATERLPPRHPGGVPAAGAGAAADASPATVHASPGVSCAAGCFHPQPPPPVPFRMASPRRVSGTGEGPHGAACAARPQPQPVRDQ